MELLLVLFSLCGGLLCVAFIGSILYAIRRAEAARRAYLAAAAHVGLTQVVVRKSLGLVVAVEGAAGPFRVWIGFYRAGRHEQHTRVTVSGNGLIPSGLDLRAEGLASQMGKAVGGREIVIGDAGFDGEVYARGPEDLLRALCDARARSLIRALVRLDGHVLYGGVRVETTKAHASAEPVTAALETALEAARCLVPPENVVERIADLVRCDPEIGVRERCLLYLARAHPEHPAVSALLREALTMSSPELRVRAAIALGAEGRETLLGLVGSRYLDAEYAADGIRALGEALPEASGIEILQDALRLTCRPVVQALIEALALRGSAAAVAPLRAAIVAPVLGSELRREVHEAIARIQSRLTGAEAGQISVTDAQADAGQLSLSDAAAGQLSLDQPAADRRNVATARATET
jgi:hypothetical protein